MRTLPPGRSRGAREGEEAKTPAFVSGSSGLVGSGEYGEVVEGAAEELLEADGVDVHAGAYFGGLEAEALSEGDPFVRGVVPEEAGDAVGCVGEPVEEHDAALGEGALDLVVLDDKGAPGDSGALGGESVGLGLVVEDVSDDDDIDGVVREGDFDAVVSEDFDGFSAAGGAFESSDADALGATRVGHDGSAECAVAAADVEDLVVWPEVRDDGIEESAEAVPVDGLVERGHGRLEGRRNGHCGFPLCCGPGADTLELSATDWRI